MKYLILSLVVVVGAGLFFVFSKTTNFEVSPSQNLASINSTSTVTSTLPSTTEAEATDPIKTTNGTGDIENQKPLANPPSVIKSIYVTSWVAGGQTELNRLINLAKETEINAMVIDIKDYSGYITYDIQNSDIEKYKAKELRTPRINTVIKKLHDEGIYAIARITIFQDPVLAKARPDLAVQSKSTGTTWKDNKGLAWMDPASKEVWDYNIMIAKDAFGRGFDEVNFDYIRFPSDGKMSDMSYPVYDGKNTKSGILRSFMKYLREQTAGNKISADLFGLTTVNSDDLGIGQVIENAYQYFDYVCPMVYPSHYASGFLGYKKPALYPYEVVKYSMEIANQRLKNCLSGNGTVSTTSATSSTSTPAYSPKCFVAPIAKLRPWLQDFDLGADYTAEMVREQIQAVHDAGLSDGWMLWDPRNVYTKGALLPN
ncbi:MAG: putative glycoside hydrolase [Candidatus Paceibacterota bacterium]|jgi:hypothetical protein